MKGREAAAMFIKCRFIKNQAVSLFQPTACNPMIVPLQDGNAPCNAQKQCALQRLFTCSNLSCYFDAGHKAESYQGE